MSDLHTYTDLRLLPAALALLDLTGDPQVAPAVKVHPDEQSDAGVTATIDWDLLIGLTMSSDAHARVAIARSLLDGTLVDLSKIADFEPDTYALMMRALTTTWPAPPPQVDELVAHQDLNDVDAVTLQHTVVAPAPPVVIDPSDWLDPETGKPGCPSCAGLRVLEDGADEPAPCTVCEARGVATVTQAELWLGRERV